MLEENLKVDLLIGWANSVICMPSFLFSKLFVDVGPWL